MPAEPVRVRDAITGHEYTMSRSRAESLGDGVEILEKRTYFGEKFKARASLAKNVATTPRRRKPRARKPVESTPPAPAADSAEENQ